MMARAGVLAGMLALAAGGAAGQESQRPHAFRATGTATATATAQRPQAQAHAFTFTSTTTASATGTFPRTTTGSLASAGFDSAPHAGRFRLLAVAKWVTLAGAVTAAAFGYNANRVADSRYQELDRLCQAQPTRCLSRLQDGRYADADLESRYQDVRGLDRRATFGLVSAEVGLAGAVTLFLLDLRHAGGEPPDIPYKPPQLQVGPTPSGGMEVRLRLLR